MRNVGLFSKAFCIFLLFLIVISNDTQAAENGFKLTVEKNLIYLDAKNASSHAILRDLEKKAGITVKIFDGVKDGRVTLRTERVPLYAADKLLAQMGMKNVGVVYDRQTSKMAIYVLPVGKDIKQYVQGKTLVSQASFRNGKDRNEIKGKPIISQTRGKNNVPIRYVANEILLKFHLGTKQEEIDGLLKKYNLVGSTEDGLSKIGYIKVFLADNRDIQEVIKELHKENILKNSEPNYIAAALAAPSDPLYSQQWYVPDTKFDLAWEKLKNKAAVKVAVVDSGIDMTHPDLAGKIEAGYDFVNGDKSPVDDNGHGTFVSGIIAASGNNLGIKGLYEYAKILPVKVMDQWGQGTYEDVSRGIVFAADQGARVINLSIGGYAFSYLLQDAVDYALEKGCILVAAGGNDGIEQEMYPAAYPDVIGVSALYPNGQIWGSSNRGRHIDVCAPGENIISTGMRGSYTYASGTSASTPMVSALVAVLCSEKNNLSCSYIRRLIFQMSIDCGEKGYDKIYGNGEIDAIKTLKNDVKPFHDVAVKKVSVEPLTFKPGNSIFIIGEIHNVGSFKVEEITVILNQITNNNKIELVRNEIKIEDSHKVVFEIINAKAVDNIKYEIEVILKDDINIENNRAQSINYIIRVLNGIFILYKNVPPVHGWIAYQAFNKLPSSYSDLREEVNSHLGPTSDTSPYLSGSWSAPTSWMLDHDNPSSQSTAVIQGAWVEDQPLLEFRYMDHFWDEESGYNEGLPGYDSALKTMQDRFDKAVNTYVPGATDNRMAYWWLGRAAHLLMDMSVPAHVLLDPHPVSDSFEEYTAHNENYKLINWNSSTATIPDYKTLSDYTKDTPSNYNKYLTNLMYHLADYANDYDSDNRDGRYFEYGGGIYRTASNTIDSNKTFSEAYKTLLGINARKLNSPADYIVVSNSKSNDSAIVYNTAFYSNELNNNPNVGVRVYYTDGSSEQFSNITENEVPWAVCGNIYQEKLEGRAIGYVAALYQLFWNETHEVLVANNPYPEPYASNVSINTDLSWSDGGGAVSYNVYFGTDSSPDSSEFKGNQSSQTYDPGTLSYGTTYYWRIDSVNSAGTTTGTVWSFTTQTSPTSGYPAAPINPYPANTATNIPTNITLSWSNGGGATSYDVYFGQDNPPVDFRGNQTTTIFNRSGLDQYSTYYWRIDARNSYGVTQGPVWRFTTSVPSNLPNLQIAHFYVYTSTGHLLEENQEFMHPGQTYEIQVWPVSKDNDCVNGIDPDKDTVETDTYHKYALSDDEGTWSRLYRNYTQAEHMDKDDSKKETFQYTVPSSAAGKRIYFHSIVDASSEVTETNENDNWSDIEWYPIQGSCDLIISYARLTNNRTYLNLGDHYGLEMAVRNLGPDGHPMDIRSAYYIKKPGSKTWQYVADDGTDANLLVPGQDNYELTLHEPFTADLAGTYEVKVCADYKNEVNETNESNNCTTFSFTVCSPDPVVANFTPSPPSGVVPLTVNFTDTSTGTITSWFWSFGDDGTSTAQNPTHTYTETGGWPVRLTVSGPCGTSTTSSTIRVNCSPIVANFIADPVSGVAPLTVGFTDTSTGTIWSRSWHFGDGSTSTSQNPSHTYSSPGIYTVTLFDYDDCGSYYTKTSSITVTSAVVANFTASPTSGEAPLTVSFTDTSTGTITSRSWDFGDGGTSTSQSPNHIYTSAGIYTVTLTVTGPSGSNTKATTITVTAPVIIAAFTANPTNGMAPLSVSFTNQSTGSITSWSWDFGDGTSSTAMNPTHTYSNAGSYTVSLTAVGPDGNNTKSDLVVVTTLDNCACDLNTDGRCDMRDWLAFGKNWGSTTCNSAGIICQCDLNHDGRCDMRDWLLFGTNWGKTACPRASWSMSMHDRQHTGRSAFIGPHTNNIKWIAPIGAQFSSPVVGADGTVYVGGGDYLFAIDGATGNQKWLFDPYTGGYDINTSPAIGADGTIYFTSYYNVYALDWITGKRKWLFTASGSVNGSPTIGVDGTVYIGSGNNVYALDGATGNQKWIHPTGGIINSAPALGVDGTVYVGSGDYNVYALNGTTGSLKWAFTTGRWIEGSPSVGPDGTVYVGSDDGKVYALNGGTGSLIWSFATGNMVNSTPAIGYDGAVYVGSWDGRIYALDGVTGDLIWSFNTGDIVSGSPAIGADGTVYVGSWNKNIYALDGETGNQKWSYTTGSTVSISPAIGAAGTLYVGSYDGNIYAISDIPGDINKDCVVNLYDYSILSQYYNQTGCGIIADLNNDCVVDGLDYAILSEHFSESCAQ